MSFHKSRVLLVAVTALSLLSASTCPARSPIRKYSKNLKGKFYVDDFYFPGFGWHRAVGVISLDEDSPLHQADVKRFDVITRLDNIRVTDLERLEKHYRRTKVRFFRNDNTECYEKWINIP